MASDRYEEKYTKPDLRRRLKAEIKQSDQGGEPGQWSARKSQLLVKAYEKQGGGYREDEKDEAAQSLEAWTAQNWQTVDGQTNARQGEITKRYLPEDVWQSLSEAEKRQAEKTKRSGSKADEQYVAWTPAIKRAMREAGYAPEAEAEGNSTKAELYEQAQTLEISGRSQMGKAELQQAVSQAKAEALAAQTREQLYEQAQALAISGRSQMTKDELVKAIQAASANNP
ncbi:Rho termination factor N-terminal domain-containing protein [Almyronema epifaneia]|uniref:Rho termination factor N-terminal domain-containing protein n=1 Tax=Almyronema epifaneia S1 TaxID=2991925 RepID=A0ABW6IDC3_9CYAN